MANTILVPSTASDCDAALPSGSSVMRRHVHAVHFYEEDASLHANVGMFLNKGLDGDRLIVIATAPLREKMAVYLGPDAMERAVASGRLTILDADETLERLMTGAEIDPERFHAVLTPLFERRSDDAPRASVHVLSEMVALLWRAGSSRAAQTLEQLLDESSQRHSLQILCAYGNVLTRSGEAGLMDVCSFHTHVLLPERRKPSSRGDVEEQDARGRVDHAEQANAEVMAVLGHDLRNPLGNILTSARLLRMRRDLPEEVTRRLERMIASGARMQRMIEQAVDVTSDPREGSYAITREASQDVGALTTSLVEATRRANPTRIIEHHVDSGCTASVDCERIEQALKTLIGNALAHGAVDLPVRVSARTADGSVFVEVHNGGTPIAEDVRERLFEPFGRARASSGPSEGLGLGLCIAQRIAVAHGGRIDVDSSAENGTRFVLRLPRD